MDTLHKCDKECPVGHSCERCNLYRPIYKETRDGETRQIYDCQVNHLAQFGSDLLKGISRLQAAIESMRNDMVKEQKHLRLLAENTKAHTKRIGDVPSVQTLRDGAQGHLGYTEPGRGERAPGNGEDPGGTGGEAA